MKYVECESELECHQCTLETEACPWEFQIISYGQQGQETDGTAGTVWNKYIMSGILGNYY